MTLVDLWNKSILILGFDIEGENTYRFLRSLYPGHVIGIADTKLFEQLTSESQDILPSDRYVRLHLGREYLSSIALYDVIIKESRFDLTESETQQILNVGKTITSHAEIFFFNCPGIIVGITGPHARKNTAKIIHKVLALAKSDSCLVGDARLPSLHFLKRARTSTIFIFEMSVQVLKGFKRSPHIAIVLSHAQDMLEDVGFLGAYQNIAMHQSSNDYLINNPSSDVAQQIASKSKAKLIPYSSEITLKQGCFIEEGNIIYRTLLEQKFVMCLDEIQSQVSCKFDFNAVLTSIIACRILGVKWECIIEAIKNIECINT